MESKRERKPTTFFKAPESVKKVVAEIPAGNGITLGDNEYFCHELGKIKADSEFIKHMHRLLFGTVSNKQDAKKRIRQFSGFPDGTNREDKIAEVTGKKQHWTIALLKIAVGGFGLEKGGNRDVIIERLIDYLMKPSETKSASSSTGKRKSSSATTKGKTAKKVKISRPPSAYQLYVRDHGPVVREANPDIRFGEVSKLVGQQWGALSDGEKEVCAVFDLGVVCIIHF